MSLSVRVRVGRFAAVVLMGRFTRKLVCSRIFSYLVPQGLNKPFVFKKTSWMEHCRRVVKAVGLFPSCGNSISTPNLKFRRCFKV